MSIKTKSGSVKGNLVCIHKNQISINLPILLGKLKLKYSIIFYGTLVILGIVFLALVLEGAYLNWYKTSILLFLSGYSASNFGVAFVLGGIMLLTIGIVGIGRQCFKNHKKLFTILAVLLVPTLTFASFVVGYSFAISSSPTPPLRSEITQLTVVDTDPLILSVTMKAITNKDSLIDTAWVYNDNDDGASVAHCFNEESVLPAGSEVTLNLNFNTTLPSGNYTLSFSTWHVNHDSSPFTIP